MTTTFANANSPRRFGRRWWLDGLRNLAWVAMVTVLIWVFADLEKTETREVTLKIRLGVGSSADLTLTGPTDYEVKVALRGSNSILDRYSRDMADKGWILPVDLSEKGTLGENMLQTSDLIDTLTSVSKSGMTIASASPRFIKATLARPEAEYSVRLVLTAGKDLVLLDKTNASQREAEVRFRAQGSRSELAQLAALLKDANSRVAYDLSAGYGVGRHTLDVAATLGRSDAIARSGVTVLQATPASDTVELDKAIVVPDIEVKFRSTGATVGEAVIDPPRMSITVAQSRWDEIHRLMPKPALETAVTDLQAGPTDKPLAVEVNPFIAGVPVRPELPVVQVSVKITQLTDETTLTVPVRILTPLIWAEDGTWERYVLKRKDAADWRKKITFKGPKKDIEKLQPEDIDAYVTLTDNDKMPTTSWLGRDVEVRIAKGLQLQIVGEKLKVDFRLDPRTAPTPP